jgi:triosephosphate isomerase
MTLFIANWKMYSPPLPVWAKRVSEARFGSDAHIVLCPPFTQLAAAQMVLNGTEVDLGAQDCHYKDEGAFTGDVSANMLKRAGCSYAIVGHSERRQYHHETNEIVKAKADSAMDHGLEPIICVGESLAQREAGEQETVVAQQLSQCIPARAEPYVIAYEPIWAIGTGKTASADDIAKMHAFIKKQLDSEASILYGGSVKPANAAEILGLDGVDGVLVGSASLKPEDFAAIIEAE